MRQSFPWYRAPRDTWYVEINGTQHSLGRQPEAASPPVRGKRGWNPPAEIMQAFHRLMADGPKLPTADKITTAKCCDLFLDWSKRHNEERTYRWYRWYLQPFCDLYGGVPALDLKPFHVTQWLDKNPSWRAGRRHAITAVKRAFNWCEEQGVLPANPLKRVRKPPANRRDRVLTTVERAELLAAIADTEFREFVYALQATGCRPSEVSKVTASHCNLQIPAWVFPPEEHKTGKRTGKPRVVYLSPGMVELTRKLILKHPAGPLFRGPRGSRPFSPNGIRCRFRNLRRKLPHLKGVISYTYRHTYATSALENGIPPATVAELLGHSDLTMLAKYYAHMSEKKDHLKAAVIRLATAECA
jgi:integrase